MDHLKLSNNDDFRPTLFVTQGQTRFEADSDAYDFYTFPTHCRWSEQDRRFEQRGIGSNTNVFFQEWLFFGLLITVLDLDKDTFVRNDFIDGNVITTKKLDDYLKNWENTLKSDKSSMTMQMIKAQLALDKARTTINKLCFGDAKSTGVANANDPIKIEGKLALSIMVLGETLTNAKCKIVVRHSFSVRGWHGDANQGWGIPSVLTDKMNLKRWCKRTVYVLSHQLQSNATALLAAYELFSNAVDEDDMSGHENCTIDECVFEPTEESPGSGGEKVYKTRHRTKNCTCAMIGPDETQLEQIIQDGQIPVLELKGSSVLVKSHEPYEPYTTISHVWADGFGNDDKNQLPECQLKFIDKVVRHWKQQPLFWMDTLTIPPRSSELARKLAIQKIAEVYSKSKCTIVLDNGLRHVSSGKSIYHEPALRILASGWMRRLWTLQEAYLSRKIFFAFADDIMLDLDEIEDLYPQRRHDLASNLATAARTFFHQMMGPERWSRIYGIQPSNRYDIIASVLRAAQWRSIHNPAIEVLALATLLEINYVDVRSIEESSKTSNSTTARIDDGGDSDKEAERNLGNKMKDLWILLNETSPGCIPSGIIFLPGKRIPIRGYGWAPLTWMSGKEIDYPDPLSVMRAGAVLNRDHGLSVHYPGFLLHTQSQETVLRSEHTFQFPSDSTLLEWYEVEQADDSRRVPKGKRAEGMRFAIILCRPKPREQKEIALLVNIKRTVIQRVPGFQKENHKFEAHIVCRVWIWRQTGIDTTAKWQLFTKHTGQRRFICGEELDPDQEWLLDIDHDSSSDVDPTSLGTVRPSVPIAAEVEARDEPHLFTPQPLQRNATFSIFPSMPWFSNS